MGSLIRKNHTSPMRAKRPGSLPPTPSTRDRNSSQSKKPLSHEAKSAKQKRLRPK